MVNGNGKATDQERQLRELYDAAAKVQRELAAMGLSKEQAVSEVGQLNERLEKEVLALGKGERHEVAKAEADLRLAEKRVEGIGMHIRMAEDRLAGIRLEIAPIEEETQHASDTRRLLEIEERKHRIDREEIPCIEKEAAARVTALRNEFLALEAERSQTADRVHGRLNRDARRRFGTPQENIFVNGKRVVHA
jgi:hypothetical protein